MTEPTGNSHEDYAACLEYAASHNYWAMYHAMTEDGYDPEVSWRELMTEKAADSPAERKV